MALVLVLSRAMTLQLLRPPPGRHRIIRPMYVDGNPAAIAAIPLKLLSSGALYWLHPLFLV